MDDCSVEAEVVTLGEVMALVLADPGVPLEATAGFDLGFAGAEATVAVGLRRLGHPTCFVGRLGADPLGRRIRRELRGHGVDVESLTSVDTAPTGLLVRDASGTRPISVQYYRAGSAASTLTVADLPEDRIRRAGLVHVTAITAALSDSAHECVLRTLDIARESGVPVSFDPNVRLKVAGPSRWAELIAEMTPYADFVLTGADDARVVTDGDPAAWFLEHGAKRVVVKDGARGAWETDGATTVKQDALLVTAVDPVGAGDAFAAGWLHGLLTGEDAATRLRYGSAVAALCVGTRGDTPGLPDRTTLEQVLGDADDVER